MSNDYDGSYRMGGSSLLDGPLVADPAHFEAAHRLADDYATRRNLTDAERAELRAMLGAA